MPAEQATTALIKNLERLNIEYSLSLCAGQIKEICVNIVSLFAEIRETVLQYDYLCTPVNERIIWSPEYQQVVDKFMGKLLTITLPIGEISPGEHPCTLWVGDDGIIAAKKFGHPTQKTLPVALIDFVMFGELKDAFFPDFSKNMKDTAVACLYWALLSSLYASNTRGDVNLYIAENPIHSISFFWNFELPLIRKTEQKIYINVLTPTAHQALNLV